MPASSDMARSCTPNARGIDGPVMSESRMPTRYPRRLMETASKEVTRDLPTPPLPLATAMTLRTELISCGASKKSFRLFVLEGQFSPQLLQSWVQFSGTSREEHSS